MTMSRVRNIVQKMNLKKYFDRKDSSVAVYQPSKDSAYVHMAGKVYYFDDSTDEAIFDSWDEEVNEFVRVSEENQKRRLTKQMIKREKHEAKQMERLLKNIEDNKNETKEKKKFEGETQDEKFKESIEWHGACCVGYFNLFINSTIWFMGGKIGS